jgi:hypothetical protein
MELLTMLVIGLIILSNLIGIVSITVFLIKENREKSRSNSARFNKTTRLSIHKLNSPQTLI